ncbi:unnamed protein product [Echinostoma caproni]|uniref:Uncharacterized protein n=1 Tax=Echinostoma caproni TaxID=27848 RepID=A0A183A6Q8_9TREM|nr:unnamed protein product [Echinostoma caproni]
MRLPPLILILPRHCSDNFKLSLTPSILTFILQSTDGDNRTWGVPGHEHIHYPTDPRSTLTELGPVTSVQRRRVWQPVVDIVFIVVVVDNVILYGSALIELTRLTGTNRWTISLATGPDHKGDLIIFIAYGWHVSRYKSPNVFLRPEASLNSKQIHTDCIVLCPVPVANQSATNPTSSENIPIITTNSTATNNITKTTPAGSITSTITKITENPLPKRYSERTDITPTQFSYWTNTLDKCLSQPFPFQTATRRCCSLFRWPYSPRSFRCIVPFIFYVCCLLMLCTNAYRVETHVTPKHISGSPEPKRFGNAPDKTQLRARTPNYLFRLHDRHMRHWWDFDQFEADRLRHPVHRSRTSDMNIEKWNDASLGVITAVRHHQHIETISVPEMLIMAGGESCLIVLTNTNRLVYR